jgi:hypothetical protein
MCAVFGGPACVKVMVYHLCLLFGQGTWMVWWAVRHDGLAGMVLMVLGYVLHSPTFGLTGASRCVE